jgi:hypothetical protein
MLLPALASAKNRAQRTTDINNNRQMMLAANIYPSDNSDSLPGCGWGTTDACWAHGANLTPVGGATAASFATILAQQITFFRQGELFPILKNEKTMMCPADVVDQNYYARNIYFTSYVWNGAVCGFGAPGGPRAGIAPKSHKVTAFKPLSILQWETDELTPFYFNDCSSFPDEGISSKRHHGNAVVGLVSGSTQILKTADWYKNGLAGAAGSRGGGIPATLLPNQLWCNPKTADGLP